MSQIKCGRKNSIILKVPSDKYHLIYSREVSNDR